MPEQSSAFWSRVTCLVQVLVFLFFSWWCSILKEKTMPQWFIKLNFMNGQLWQATLKTTVSKDYNQLCFFLIIAVHFWGFGIFLTRGWFLSVSTAAASQSCSLFKSLYIYLFGIVEKSCPFSILNTVKFSNQTVIETQPKWPRVLSWSSSLDFVSSARQMAADTP